MTKEGDFESDYFIGAIMSNYTDYRTKKFSELANNIINILSLNKNSRILDFGCATGGLLRELKNRGFENIKGTDISNWAIEYGKDTFGLDKEIDFYNRNLLCEAFDYIIVLDTLEHMTNYELETVLKLANKGLKRELLVRIPVSTIEGEDYMLDVSKNDRTHIQIHCKDWWIKTIESYGFKFVKDVFETVIYSSEGVFCGVFKIRD